MTSLTDGHRGLVPTHNAKHSSLGKRTDEVDWKTAEWAVRRMLERSIFKYGGIPEGYPILRAGDLSEACRMHFEVEKLRCPPYRTCHLKNSFHEPLATFARSCGGAIFGHKITVIYAYDE